GSQICERRGRRFRGQSITSVTMFYRSARSFSIDEETENRGYRSTRSGPAPVYHVRKIPDHQPSSTRRCHCSVGWRDGPSSGARSATSAGKLRAQNGARRSRKCQAVSDEYAATSTAVCARVATDAIGEHLPYLRTFD